MSEPIFPKYEDVSFDIEKEVWNVYALDDRSIIRMRCILIKLLKSLTHEKTSPPGVPRGATQFQTAFQNIVIVIKSPPELMGKPTHPLSPQDIEAAKKVEVGFTPYIEDWNVYRLPDGSKLKVKLVVSAIHRIVGHYDPFGYPVYFINSTNALAPVPKPKP